MIKCKTIANKLFGRENSESGRIRKNLSLSRIDRDTKDSEFPDRLKMDMSFFFLNVKTSIQQAGELKDN